MIILVYQTKIKDEYMSREIYISGLKPTCPTIADEDNESDLIIKIDSELLLD